MSTLTIRLPDDKPLRLRKLAKHRIISVNKLIEELATTSIAEFDAETRFRTLAARGWSGRGENHTHKAHELLPKGVV